LVRIKQLIVPTTKYGEGRDMSTEIDRVRVRVLPDGRMARTDAAAYLGLTVQTLSNWSNLGRGPRAVVIGSRAFYYQKDLDRFIADEVARSTGAARGDRSSRTATA
jgi:hypothetical protein